MRRTACVIDSSCVIALDHLELFPQLTFLFSEVLLPKAVRKDLFKRRISKDRIRGFFASFAFIRPCDRYDQTSVAVLLAGRRANRDRGEAEAVVQASERGAAVIVDDKWGRELARNFALEYHGTIWILGRFHELGLLSASGLRAHLVALRLRGIRLPRTEVNNLLSKVGERRWTLNLRLSSSIGRLTVVPRLSGVLLLRSLC
jgi:predicted nucleic acid-binding protein